MNSFYQLIISQGVAPEAAVLILSLPIIVTLIAFFRQIIGIKGFGVYAPVVTTFSFLVVGLVHGLIIFISILITGSIMRYIAKRLRLLYLPRMAIIIIGAQLSVFALSVIGSYYDIINLIPNTVSVFAVLVMIIIIEKFVSSQIEKGTRQAIALTLETLALSIACFVVISLPFVQGLIITYPFWIIFTTLIINILLGKWTGLRLSEYFRFRKVIQHVDLPSKK